MTSVTKETTWPNSWRSAPLWSMFERVKDVGHPGEQMLSVYRDHGVVRKDDRADNFNKTALNRDIYQLIDEGWLALNRMKAWQGSLGISPYRGIISGHYICFRPTHGEVPRFLHYLLRSSAYTAQMLRISRGVRPNQIEIDNDQLRVLEVRLPTVAVQQQIADFLDAETARIDALVDAKQQMIGVLVERLRASILDSIESCQQVVPLRRRSEIIDCKHRTAIYVETGFPVVSPGDVTPGVLDLSRCHRFVDSDDLKDLAEGVRRPRRGDIVYSRNASIGIAALVGDDTKFCMGQDVCLVRSTRQDGSGEFLSYVLNTSGLDQLDEIKIGSTFSRINVAQIGELHVPAVSEPEEDRLVASWREESERVQTSRTTLTQQITLLRERRAALITAAVSGELVV